MIDSQRELAIIILDFKTKVSASGQVSEFNHVTNLFHVYSQFNSPAQSKHLSVRGIMFQASYEVALIFA